MLKHSLHHHDFHVLYNVILSTALSMQIDILVITPKSLILLEIKNIKGQVHFKKDPRQLVRTNEKGDTKSVYAPRSTT